MALQFMPIDIPAIAREPSEFRAVEHAPITPGGRFPPTSPAFPPKSRSRGGNSKEAPKNHQTPRSKPKFANLQPPAIEFSEECEEDVKPESKDLQCPTFNVTNCQAAFTPTTPFASNGAAVSTPRKCGGRGGARGRGKGKGAASFPQSSGVSGVESVGTDSRNAQAPAPAPARAIFIQPPALQPRVLPPSLSIPPPPQLFAGGSPPAAVATPHLQAPSTPRAGMIRPLSQRLPASSTGNTTATYGSAGSGGSGGSARSGGSGVAAAEALKRKRPRFHEDQLAHLEAHFAVEQELTPASKKQLAARLGVKPRQVCVWFQNRKVRQRTRERETELEGMQEAYAKLQAQCRELQDDYELLKSDYQELLLQNTQLFDMVSNEFGCVCSRCNEYKFLYTCWVLFNPTFFVTLPTRDMNLNESAYNESVSFLSLQMSDIEQQLGANQPEVSAGDRPVTSRLNERFGGAVTPCAQPGGSDQSDRGQSNHSEPEVEIPSARLQQYDNQQQQQQQHQEAAAAAATEVGAAAAEEDDDGEEADEEEEEEGMEARGSFQDQQEGSFPKDAGKFFPAHGLYPAPAGAVSSFTPSPPVSSNFANGQACQVTPAKPHSYISSSPVSSLDEIGGVGEAEAAALPPLTLPPTAFPVAAAPPPPAMQPAPALVEPLLTPFAHAGNRVANLNDIATADDGSEGFVSSPHQQPAEPAEQSHELYDLYNHASAGNDGESGGGGGGARSYADFNRTAWTAGGLDGQGGLDGWMDGDAAMMQQSAGLQPEPQVGLTATAPAYFEAPYNETSVEDGAEDGQSDSEAAAAAAAARTTAGKAAHGSEFATFAPSLELQEQDLPADGFYLWKEGLPQTGMEIMGSADAKGEVDGECADRDCAGAAEDMSGGGMRGNQELFNLLGSMEGAMGGMGAMGCAVEDGVSHADAEATAAADDMAMCGFDLHAFTVF
ncbi:hypothetical protein CLOM_g20669 [Closterium sp. NIES-68]|nr:hypothetical protein CLOM_g20669 [Closterium sp. NIES-68]